MPATTAHPTVTTLPDAQLAPLVRAYAEAVAARRRTLALGAAILAAALALAMAGAEVDAATLWANLGNATSYAARLTRLDSGASVLSDPAEWFWGLRTWSLLLGETLLIAYVGTLTGGVAAFCLCFLASPRLMPSAWVRAATRRGLEFARTVPEIVFALVFVVAFGLGPLPGVLAIAIHTTGALGKLFAEVVDNIDPNPIEAVRSSGGTWLAQVRFGAVPQILSNVVSYGLLRFEINVRGAAVMGFVGAGGIGEELITAIRKFFYADVSAILLLVIACVVAIDLASGHLRHRLLDPR